MSTASSKIVNGKTVYKRILGQRQIDSLVAVLQNLRLDTLKNVYKPGRPSYKGLRSDVKIAGTGLPGKQIHGITARLPATDSLYSIIDRLILTKKYRYYGFQ